MAIHSRSVRSAVARMAMATLFIIHPLSLQAQETQEQRRIRQLEQRLEELLRQAGEIRTELDSLKQAAPPGDLGAVEIVEQPAAIEPPAAGTIADVQTVENRVDPAAAKVFNPDIAVVGTFLGHAGQTNPFEYGEDSLRAAASMDEAELSFEAYIDPYAKGKFFIAVTPEEVDLEEGYAQFLTLPWDLTAKVGKTKATFGKANTWHTHLRPWVDQPLMIHNFFGDEGLRDSGISVSKLFPSDAFYTEATVEAYSGDVEDVFGRRSDNDLFYNGHLRAFRDLGENSNLEVGTSLARGTLPESGGSSRFVGADVTYRWKPLAQGGYRSFIGRFEALANDRDDVGDRLVGYYASADYKFARRWIAGLRVDRADRAFALEGGEEARRFTDRSVSALLTFWPSEFSQLRGQLRRTSYGGLRDVTELLLQLQFSIGAHGAHSF